MGDFALTDSGDNLAAFTSSTSLFVGPAERAPNREPDPERMTFPMAGRVLAFFCVIALLVLVPSCSQNAQLSSIEITPSGVSFEDNVPCCDFIPTDSTAQLTAIGTYENGKGNGSTYTKDITNMVDWSSSLPSVATVTAGGLVSPTGCGVGVVKAQAGTGGVFADVAINVCMMPTGSGSLGSLRILAGSQVLNNRGDKAQFKAIGTYANSNAPKDLTGQVKWSTSDARVATVSSTGLVTLVASCSNIGSGPQVTITAAAPGNSSLAASSSITVPSCSAN